MTALSLFSLELGRLLRSRFTWLILLLTLLSPLAGLTLYRPLSSLSSDAYTTTTLGTYLANPALAGGVAGGILFAVLTLYELDRANRSQVDVLVEAVVSPLSAALIRLWALLCAAALAQAAVLLLYLPFTYHAAGAVFDGETYGLCYLLFMGLSLPLSILSAASAYQFTRRLDLSLVLFAAFAGLSLTVWSGQWQLCWLNPCVWAVSDDFSNQRLFQSAAYVRLTWLAGLSGVWGISYLSIRRYGKGVLGSLARNARRVFRPALALLLLFTSGWAYAAQPFLDHSNPDLTAMNFYALDLLEGVSCSSRSTDVRPNTDNGTVWGSASYRLLNDTGREQTVAFAINPGYRITSARANGADTPFTISDYQEMNQALLEVVIPSDAVVELRLEYGGFPRDWNISATTQGTPEITAQYLCLENAELSLNPLNIGYEYEDFLNTIDITLPAQMTVIPFGVEEAELLLEHPDGTRTWRILQQDTASTILYAGDYIREDISVAGQTVQFYYGRKHQAVMEESGAADAVREVIAYCTEHYGPCSFTDSGTLKLIESRVVGGGYAAAGASLLDEGDFTAQNLSNANKGSASGEVMIHELVHQWWGLGNMFDVSSGDSPWSAEGLTVYTTYRIIKELYGEEYARENYVEQWQTEVDDYYLNFYVRHPEYLERLPEEERLAISNSLSTVRQYSEMPLKILKAETLVGGEEAMDQILYDLFQRELDPAYPYLTYQDFLNACGLTEEELNLD